MNPTTWETTGTQAHQCAGQLMVRAAMTTLGRNKLHKLEMTTLIPHQPAALGSSSTCHCSISVFKLTHNVIFSFREQWKSQWSEAGKAALTTSCAKEIINNSKRKQRLKGLIQVIFSEQQFPCCWKCCSPVQSTRSPPPLSLTVVSFPGGGRHWTDMSLNWPGSQFQFRGNFKINIFPCRGWSKFKPT